MNKVREFLTKNKKLTTIVFAIIGICLICISYLPKKNENSNITQLDYEHNLETRTKEIIEQVAGKNTTKVMITFKNTYIPVSQNNESFSFEKKSDSLSYKSMPLPDIAGVMIVCNSLKYTDDFLTIKKAVSTCLNIPQSKIYIIGGASENEKKIN